MTKTAIIDLDSILYAAAWGKKIPDGQGDFVRDEKGRLVYEDKTDDEIFESLDLILTSILEETDATNYIAYVKGQNTGRHRYNTKPDYKSNRPKESPKWWEKTVLYSINNWAAILIDDIEVDDAVNITRLNIENSFIVAVDRDLLNLEGTHYNWKKKEWITVSKEEEFYYFWTDMITGQFGDGITGIPGIGKKGAEKMMVSMNVIIDIFWKYIKTFGEEQGIKEFYQNYTCLKILKEHKGFEIPKSSKYKVKEEQINTW